MVHVEPLLMAVSTDRRRLTISNASDSAEIAIDFRGSAVEFSRESDGGGQLVTLTEPLAAWEALGGFTTIRVDGERIGASESLIHAERKRLREMITKQSSNARSSSHGVSSPDVGEEAPAPSLVPLPIGSRSLDGSAAVGAEGHLFLIGGSNSLLDQYTSPATPEQKDELERSVRRWSSLVEQRLRIAEGLGATFVQMFIPDKSSVLDSGIPGLGPVTPLLDRLESRLSSAAHYVSGRQALRAPAKSDGDVSRRWLKLDSHTSAHGSLQLSRALLGAVGDSSFMDDVEFTGTRAHVGDLGARFFGAPIPERISTPDSAWLRSTERGRKLIAHHVPKHGHQGRTLDWHTPNAPLNAKVLVFGNSFFGARDIPNACNFWISRAFREHRFVWSAEMIEEKIRSERPDVVICQTVERFLPSVPAS